MIYAAKTNATDGALTVGGINGKLLNDVLAFESKADYQAKLDELWANGKNLIRLSRKDVEGYFGRNFAVSCDGLVFSSYEAAQDYDDMRAADIAA